MCRNPPETISWGRFEQQSGLSCNLLSKGFCTDLQRTTESQGRIKPRRMAYLTNPAVSWMLSFSMMRAR